MLESWGHFQDRDPVFTKQQSKTLTSTYSVVCNGKSKQDASRLKEDTEGSGMVCFKILTLVRFVLGLFSDTVSCVGYTAMNGIRDYSHNNEENKMLKEMFVTYWNLLKTS